MNCPKCNKEKMNDEVFESVHIERCPVCKGIYLDKGELEALLKEQMGNAADTLFFSHLSDQMDAQKAHCHKCDHPMTPQKTVGDIRIDRCEKCEGAFLDQGELATIQLYTPT